MDYQDIIVSCKNCNSKVPMSKTRPVKNMPLLICLNCYKDIYGLNDEKVIQAADSNRANYTCSYCSYQFSRGKETFVEHCPYCGKGELKQENTPIIVKTPKMKKLTDY